VLNNVVLLRELFDVLHEEVKIDKTDWTVVTRFAEEWKISVADALLELNYVDEVALAKSLSKANHLPYVPGDFLKFDFSSIHIENFDDLVIVGAIPIHDFRLAISNPYDDHRGFLGNEFCLREMVVTERSSIMNALRQQGLRDWLREKKV